MKTRDSSVKNPLGSITPGALDSKRKFVLVVDDSKEMLDLISRHFSKEGLLHLAAHSVEDASKVWAARKNEISVLVTDLQMPELSGDELAAKFLSEKSSLRVILITGYENHPASHSNILVLPKPFRFPQLIEKVLEALN